MILRGGRYMYGSYFTPLQSQKDLIELRTLDGVDINNTLVFNKTLFIGENEMVIKNTDGSCEKWEINKVFPVDEKDLKIKNLEKEIQSLKEMIGNEYREYSKSVEGGNEQKTNDNVYDNSRTETNG